MTFGLIALVHHPNRLGDLQARPAGGGHPSHHRRGRRRSDPKARDDPDGRGGSPGPVLRQLCRKVGRNDRAGSEDLAAAAESGSDLASALTETAASLHEITSNIQSAKSLVLQQEKIARETVDAGQEDSDHTGTLKELVAKQNSAVETSGSAVNRWWETSVPWTETSKPSTRVCGCSFEAAESGRSQFDGFRKRVGTVDRQSESLHETNRVIADIADQPTSWR